MLIILCIFKTERTGFLIESQMCLRTVSAACIFMSDNCHFSNFLTQSTAREALMTHCFLKISHKSCENKPLSIDRNETVNTGCWLMTPVTQRCLFSTATQTKDCLSTRTPIYLV